MTDLTIASPRTDAASRPLPMPTSARWMPLRLGLVDLFYYDDEVFPFVDGRLLLRGNNGAGKSKVLALTLPFLLDGDLSAHRIEPDGDRQKRMEWNLLLGGEHPNSERTGYTWLEFGRLDEQGVAQFTTIGAGLKAVRGKPGIAKHWFFVTSARVGDEFSLTDDSRVVLGKARLDDALESLGAGHVYESKTQYRRAVDERLFRLGERRYTELMELLLQIRAPQLSKRPSESALDSALSGSLTPVGDDVIASVANGLRSLDEVRDELAGLVDVRRSLSSFLEHYRAYAQVLLRRRAEGPRRDQAEHDRLGREIIAVTADHDAHVAVRDAAVTELAELRAERTEREAEREALRDSPHVQSEREIARAEQHATEATERAATASKQAARAVEAAQAARTESETAARTAGAQRAAVESTLATATKAAKAAGLDASHGVALDAASESAVAADRTAAGARIAARREALARIARLRTDLAAAEQDAGRARTADADAESRWAEATARAAEADDAVETAITQHLDAVQAAVGRLAELSVEDAAVEAYADWVRVRDGVDPLASALQAAATVRRAELHAERERTRLQRTEQIGVRDDLRAEIGALESGTVREPEAWPTRIQSGPESLPLWRAVGFADGLDEAECAGLEAALEASGLLTAVLHADGAVRSPDHGEVLLSADAPAVAGPSLADVLAVELPADSAVTADAVAAVLHAIGLGEQDAPAWASTSGAFGLGPARGAWTVDSARYIGETARAAARAARLEVARAELAEAQRLIAGLEDVLTGIDGRLGRITAEAGAVPSPSALVTLERDATTAHVRVESSAADRVRTASALATAIANRDARAVELETDAAMLGLPTAPAELDALAGALDAYERATTDFAHGAVQWLTAAESAGGARRRADAATASADEYAVEASRTDDDALRARTYAETVRARFGAAVESYRAEVEAADAALRKLGKTIDETNASREASALDAAKSESRLEALRADLARAAASRTASIDALRATVALGIAEVAMPAAEFPSTIEEWTATAGVHAARAIESGLADIDHSDVRSDRLTTAVATRITELQRDLSRHDYEVAVVQADAGTRVFVSARGSETTLPALDASLAAQIEQHERLLSAREREIIQNHLVTEVGTQLSELIGAADRQIAELNQELRTRPTSTGMVLRVRWIPRGDGPGGLAEARRILGSVGDVWSDEERTALGDFLQARIAAVRDDDETGNWYDHLGAALDYRGWHRFVVERKQGDNWRAATGPASGGERVLAASIPLFAAASSHYRTAADPHAPRLVMLDEAFAGVDDDSRANCLGLLAEFDLDVVMTSEREWGCYAEVPGLSIAQLSRFDDTPTVHVQLWRWDGRRRERIGEDAPTAADGELW
ncbi:TIGR02680 family protein [Agromyces protaetiae]|uniref:TIGR02680 family protein n=1 Tax=Agromyces protaetiae TaxID=2509455 RepID=A0A4P6FDB0_9MICO|nr:TIGR02680 family protein [Agromyces protaetiae]QAY73716.1 TIGR02680 family protein [Agromyces protaetiae]